MGSYWATRIFPWVHLMQFERCRLWTFKNNWSNVYVHPEDLALAGFYRPSEDVCGSKQGPSDLVECYFGGCRLFGWDDGDHAWSEHVKHFPHCPFILGGATTNVPLAL